MIFLSGPPVQRGRESLEPPCMHVSALPSFPLPIPRPNGPIVAENVSSKEDFDEQNHRAKSCVYDGRRRQDYKMAQ